MRSQTPTPAVSLASPGPKTADAHWLQLGLAKTTLETLETSHWRVGRSAAVHATQI